jgi:hypothetical protein
MSSNDENFAKNEKDLYLGFYSLQGMEHFSFIYSFGKRNSFNLKKKFTDYYRNNQVYMNEKKDSSALKSPVD